MRMSNLNKRLYGPVAWRGSSERLPRDGVIVYALRLPRHFALPLSRVDE